MGRGQTGPRPNPNSRRVAAVTSALAVALAAFVAWLPGAFSAPSVSGGPFACTDDLLYSSVTPSGATQLGRLVPSQPGAVVVAPIGTPIPARLNGLGFNPGDGYLYASADLVAGGYPGVVQPGELYRITSTGDASDLGPFLGFPETDGLRFTGGTFIGPNRYLVSVLANPDPVAGPSTPMLAVVDVTTRQVVQLATVDDVYQDLAFDPAGGMAYGYEATLGRLDRINPSTLTATPTPSAHAKGLVLGASWFLSNGQLLVYGTARDAVPGAAAGSVPVAVIPSTTATTTPATTTTATATTAATTTASSAPAIADAARPATANPAATAVVPVRVQSAAATRPSPEVAVASPHAARGRSLAPDRGTPKRPLPLQFGTTTLPLASTSTSSVPATVPSTTATSTTIPSATTTIPPGTTTTEPTTTTGPATTTTTVPTTGTTTPPPPAGGFELYAAATAGSREVQGRLDGLAFGPAGDSIDGASCPGAAVVSPPPSGSTTTSIVAGAANRPPVAVDDDYTTARGKALHIARPGILGNDSDPDGDPIHTTGATRTRHGSLAVAADGSFTYTPLPTFVGQDSFRYQASDGRLSSADATVTIHVVAPAGLGTTTTTTTTTIPPVAGHGTTTTTPAAVIHPPPPPTVTLTIPNPLPDSTTTPLQPATTVPGDTTAPPATPTTLTAPTTPTSVPETASGGPSSQTTTATASPADLSLHLTSSIVVPRGDDEVVVRGCAPGSEAQLSMDARPIGHATVGPDGVVSAPFVGPDAIGPHTLLVRCGARSRALAFDVVASSASEAPDGSAALLLALFVLVIVALGMGRGRLARAPQAGADGGAPGPDAT